MNFKILLLFFICKWHPFNINAQEYRNQDAYANPLAVKVFHANGISPDELWKIKRFKNLEELYFPNDFGSDSLPVFIYDLPLKKLNTGAFPIIPAGMKKLQNLELLITNSQVLPYNELAMLPQLRELHIYTLKPTNIINPYQSLTKLIIWKATIRELAKLPALNDLEVTEILEDNFSIKTALKNVVRLHIGKFTPNDLLLFPALQSIQLQGLGMSNYQLSDSIINAIQYLKNVKKINLLNRPIATTNLTALFSVLEQLPQLDTLLFRFSDPFTQFVPVLHKYSFFSRLEYLEFTPTGFMSAFLPDTLQAIKELHLHYLDNFNAWGNNATTFLMANDLGLRCPLLSSLQIRSYKAEYWNVNLVKSFQKLLKLELARPDTFYAKEIASVNKTNFPVLKVLNIVSVNYLPGKTLQELLDSSEFIDTVHIACATSDTSKIRLNTSVFRKLERYDDQSYRIWLAPSAKITLLGGDVQLINIVDTSRIKNLQLLPRGLNENDWCLQNTLSYNDIRLQFFNPVPRIGANTNGQGEFFDVLKGIHEQLLVQKTTDYTYKSTITQHYTYLQERYKNDFVKSEQLYFDQTLVFERTWDSTGQIVSCQIANVFQDQNGGISIKKGMNRIYINPANKNRECTCLSSSSDQTHRLIFPGKTNSWYSTYFSVSTKK